MSISLIDFWKSFESGLWLIMAPQAGVVVCLIVAVLYATEAAMLYGEDRL